MRTCKPNNVLLRLAAIGISVFALLICVTDQSYADKTDGQDPKGGGSEPRSVFAPGQLVIKFSSDTVYSDAFREGLGAEQESYLPLSGAYLYELDSGGELEDIADSLSQLDKVEYAHPNYLMDELHPVQGSYPMSDKAETGSYDDQPAAATLDLASAQEITSGSGVTVAVIDGGVDFGHTRLLGTELPGYDFVDNDDYPFDEPGGRCSGHGTFVAGIVHLAAPDAKIRAYRVTDPGGNGDGFTLAQSIERAVNDGCHVINLSLVLMGEHLAVRDAISYATSQGVVVVAAAGNQGTSTAIYPGAWNNTIAVAAIDSTAVLADFSCFGSHIDVCAPGTNIYSTYLDNGYGWWSGTSFATPFVTAQAALALSLTPTPTWYQVINALAATAENIDEANANHVGMIGSGLCNPAGSVEWLSAAACCELLGDVNGNGISYEIDDATILATAISEGDTSYLPCIGNADITGDCLIDIVDFYVMEAIISGDSILPSSECGDCESYELISGSIVHSAAVIPDTLYASFPEDIELLVAPTVSAWLTSTNAPSYYLPELVSDEPIFAWVDTAGGLTNDSVVVTLNHSPGPMGTYYNTILFHVDGVTDAAELTICLTITPPDTLSYASISPDVMNFYGDPNTYSFLAKAGWLSSTNAPANYLGLKLNPGNDFIFFEDSTHFVYDSIQGQTNDSVIIVVIPSQSPGPGQYVDSILFEVDGVMDPVLLVVNVTLDSMGQAACCVMPGDIDGDAYPYSLADLAGLETILVTRDMTPIMYCPGNADVTGDCVIDYADLSYINSVVMGWGPMPPFAECASCDSYTLGTTPMAAIQSLQQVQLGQPASVAVTLDNWGVGIGGFELLFSHDANVLNFINAIPGPEFYDLTPVGCGWEYFTYQVDANGIRVVGVADLNNGEVHPPCTMASPLPATLFSLEFMTTDDRTYLGQRTSINFRWVECGDNAFSSVSGENLYFDRIIYNADGALIWDEFDDSRFPEEARIPFVGTSDSCFSLVPGSSVNIRYVAFMNGGVTFNDEGEPCCVEPGDVNDNGLAYEISDRDLLANLLANPDTVTVSYLGNADVTGDCLVDTADLTFLDAVIAGDAVPVAECGICTAYELIPDTVSPGGEMVSVWPTGLNYFAPVDSMVVYEDAFFLSSTNAPANYTAAIKDEADFTTLQNFAGTTDDSIRFIVRGGLGLTPGLYVDTLVFEVEGTQNSPLMAILTLTVEEYGGPADSAWVYPSVLTFDVPPGVSDTLLGSVLVGSTNGPAAYEGQVLGGPESFVSLLDTIGMTYDSAWIRVDPSLPDTGWYYETIEFWVSGIEHPAVLEVRLWINPNDSMPAFNLGNHPNPFNAQTNIVFDLPRAAHVRLRVYNIVGRLVTTVVDEYREAGRHSVPWDGDGLASGIYFYRIEAGEITATRKMVLLK